MVVLLLKQLLEPYKFPLTGLDKFNSSLPIFWTYNFIWTPAWACKEQGAHN